MKKWELDELMIATIHGMKESEIIRMHNDYCELLGCEDDEVFPMDELDDILIGYSASEVIDLCGKNFTASDPLFFVNRCARNELISMKKWNDAKSPINPGKIAEYIVDYRDALGNATIEHILNLYPEDKLIPDNLYRAKACYTDAWAFVGDDPDSDTITETDAHRFARENRCDSKTLIDTELEKITALIKSSTKVERFQYGKYFVDIATTETAYEATLSTPEYGIAQFMFSISRIQDFKAVPYAEFLKIVQSDIDRYIDEYEFTINQIEDANI